MTPISAFRPKRKSEASVVKARSYLGCDIRHRWTHPLRERRISPVMRVWEGTADMVEERIQRRLAAILAADVVGYSRLMGQDEAGTLAHIKTPQADLVHPRIAEDGGRIVKIIGDGVLVEFGSAVDAGIS